MRKAASPKEQIHFSGHYKSLPLTLCIIRIQLHTATGKEELCDYIILSHLCVQRAKRKSSGLAERSLKSACSRPEKDSSAHALWAQKSRSMRKHASLLLLQADILTCWQHLGWLAGWLAGRISGCGSQNWNLLECKTEMANGIKITRM